MLISTLHVLLAATLQIVPFANDAGLMSGTQPGKSFCFAFATIKGAKPHLNNTVLYTCQGNNCKALTKNTEAEQDYLHAFNKAPARFYPLYLMAKLYDETGQHEKAVAMAKEVMEKEIKIESTAIEEIKEEMRKIIEKSKAERLKESKIQTDNYLSPIYKGTKEGAYRSIVLTTKFMLQKW